MKLKSLEIAFVLRFQSSYFIAKKQNKWITSVKNENLQDGGGMWMPSFQPMANL